MEAIDINRGISIIRNYPGGSNATTILCTDGIGTFYRKYSYDADREKLWQQIQWIDKNKNRIPLPRILRKELTDEYCFYDMEYISHSVGLFEYAHSMPVDQTWMLIETILRKLEQTVYCIDVKPTNFDTIHKYYSEKVRKNLNIIVESPILKGLIPFDSLVINGKEYKNLSYYERYLSEENIQEVFSSDYYSIIHGDLTVENIICTRNKKGVEDFYIIDPNTGNIHNSPNLDYAKFLQSVHGEYEFIKNAQNVSVYKNEIQFNYTSSEIFKILYKRFGEYLNNSFDKKNVKSIYYHEMIHWLRLMPYKLINNPLIAPVFYAKMIMVFSDVINLFEEEKDIN